MCIREICERDCDGVGYRLWVRSVQVSHLLRQLQVKLVIGTSFAMRLFE